VKSAVTRVRDHPIATVSVEMALRTFSDLQRQRAEMRSVLAGMIDFKRAHAEPVAPQSWLGLGGRRA
jgi:hypothetical protein